jgi:hypothetical protein
MIQRRRDILLAKKKHSQTHSPTNSSVKKMNNNVQRIKASNKTSEVRE